MDRRIATSTASACFFTISSSASLRFNLNLKAMVITMKDRSKNRKPLQKGRNLSIEAIQTVQALKRANRNTYNNLFSELERVFDSKFRRLLKFDMMSVLRELLRQKECLLALKVFDDIRKEFCLDPDIIGFNALFNALISFKLTHLVMDCYGLMKAVGCEPDRSSFRILINGLEAIGGTGFSAILRQDAQKYYGESLELLEKEEVTAGY
ncbi:hypothetical protein CRYUN_Cryun06bG0076500 [Craigia yunnanensis]